LLRGFGFFPLMASVTLSPENIVNKIQEALRYHKSRNFAEALRLSDEVIPLVTGKQLCGNAGALYLQQGSQITSILMRSER
jgi:hypothetical protein